MQTRQMTDEMRVLQLCAKVYPSSEDILTIENLVTKIDSSYLNLIALAHQHAVLPQTYHAFKTFFPKHPLTLLLKPHYLHIVKTNMSMVTQLLQVTQLFTRHEIPLLHFKGAVLAKLIYADITLRQYGDLDILIQKKDKQKALTLLNSEHFHPEITLNQHTRKTFFSAVNVLGFHDPKKHVFIELHWELLSKNYAISWREDILWGEIHPMQLNDHTVLTLSHTNHLLYLCTHGSKHLYQRLSWVCDIDRYIQTQNNLDWEEVFNRAKELSILRILSLSLHLTQTLLNTPLPLEVEKKISQDVLSKNLATQLSVLHFSDSTPIKKGLFSFKFLWNMRENIPDKLRFTWHALFTAKLDDFKMIQLPNYVSFLYVAVRPIRLGIKYFK